MAARSLQPDQVVSRFAGFYGGINARDAISQLAPYELIRGENVILDERGGASKRLGCLSMSTFGGSGDRLLSAYIFLRGFTAPQVIIHTTAGKIYSSPDGVTWTERATGLSATARMSFETFNNKCYMSNGVDDYRAWDGTTMTTFPSAPKGRQLKVWKDTMWMSGILATPDRVYSSAAGDAETWPVSNWVDIAKGDGDVQTALSSDGTYLIVFKRNRHFIIYDPVTFANRVVDFEKGCESHLSVVAFESNIFFMSRRGVCQFLGDTPSKLISDKIDPYFDPKIINLLNLGNIQAYTYQNRIGWAIPEAGSSVSTFQIEYYPRLADESGIGPWMVQRIPCSVFVSVRIGPAEYLLAGHNSANKFLQVYAEVGSDDGVTFQGLIQTSAIDFKAPNLTKYIRRLRVLARGEAVINFKRDFDAAIYKTFVMDLDSADDEWDINENWGVGTWSSPAPYRTFTFHPDAYCRYLTIEFLDASTDIGKKAVRVGSHEYLLNAGEWGVYGIELEAAMLGVRS
jgi:hypothetical protein